MTRQLAGRRLMPSSTLTGQVFEETAAATSIAAWRSYRDRIISQQAQASR